MNPLVLLILLVLLVGTFTLSQRWAVVCTLIGTLFLTQGGALELGGFSFQPTRLLGYACFFRVVLKSEFQWSELLRIDRVLVVLYVFTTVILLTRSEEHPALRLAKMTDVLFIYFAFRAMIKTPDDFRWILGKLALLLVPFVMILLVESATHRNLFQLVGASGRSWMRGDKVRCFGSFRHPSLLGSVGACLFPVFVGLFWDSRYKSKAVLGGLLSLAVVVLSSSGGPLSVLAVSMIGWALWPIRTHMQAFRRVLLAIVIALGMVMEAPIWYLLARVSSVTGGTGWHRSYLIDVAYRHLDSWWLIGLPIAQTSKWFHSVIATTGGADITNQFISFGLNGGIIALALFVWLIVCGFSLVGKGLAAARLADSDRNDEALLWGLGVAGVAHVSNWLGITYFDQFYVIWLFQLAALASLSSYRITGSLSQPLGQTTSWDDGDAAPSVGPREQPVSS